ncbi:D-glycero-alpha-D-manno-heptose-1,7-bisphosphate 7-phosphatase [Streptomyces sp. NPDC021140]|uniref:D-glycero-alpha-D-manno-heptose-1,7-bisphosphate 7-phosphatase n=1 Tax=Streptomyces sp. NPDC021140 TaxID=3365116 RepID=UPI0037B85D98
MSTPGNAVKAVLFDRDGTLVHDVPYNGDPDRVRPVDGAREAVALLREHGIRVGVVTNQSGVARGLISDGDVRRVNRRIDDLIGPFDVWAVCPHGPDDGCHCRKPQPGMILWAAGRVCTGPADCVVVGDIGADMEAAERAGAHGILVPNDRTRPAETAAAAHVAPDLLTAVRAILDGPPTGRVLANERPIEAAYGPGPEPGPRTTAATAATSASTADDDRSGPAGTPVATAPGRGVFALPASGRDPEQRSPASPDTGGGDRAADDGGSGTGADASGGGTGVAPAGGRAAAPGTVGGPRRGEDAAAVARARTAPDAGAARARGVGDGRGRSS